MALPAAGAISLNDVNVELGLTATATITMNDSAVRTLFGIASGAIDMNTGHGKSNRAAISYTFASNATNQSLNITSISGYNAGKSDVTITVNAGVYLYSTSTGTPGLTLSGGSSGDTVTLVNNGYIMGMGGVAGKGIGSPPFKASGSAGGTALQLGFNTTVNNTNGSAYIGGGGGGGGSTTNGGGGGAGGGAGGGSYQSAAGNNGGAGGGPGSSGSGGNYWSDYDPCTGQEGRSGAGGGGGRIFPGTGGLPNQGGGAGGGGGGGGPGGTYGNVAGAGGGAGGSGNSSGSNGTSVVNVGTGGGGGGGWGASGGSGYTGAAGGGGGKAVNLNGYSITWTSGDTTRVYGSVS